MNLEKGDIIQITDEKNKWFPCLLIVDEVKSWGVQAYVTIPRGGESGDNVGNAYYRLNNNEFEKVGSAIIVAS